MIKKIECKEDLQKILIDKKIDRQFISFIDKDNKQDFVYMVRYEKDWYGEDVCSSYISYNKDKTLSRKEIDSMKKEMGLYEPFNDGILYEVDAYPIYQDFVKYPITNVEFIDEEELVKRLVKLNQRSFYDSLIK